jgi:hypothetical protein
VGGIVVDGDKHAVPARSCDRSRLRCTTALLPVRLQKIESAHQR